MTSLFSSKGRVPPPTRKLVIRKANSQRDLRPITDRLSLEKVLGLTSSSNAALACNPETGVIAYPAGCTVVLLTPRRSKQEFIHNVCKKTISALTFSRDGKYLATGESGHMPSVRVWSMEDNAHPQISEMAKGHKHGISCLAFSPNLKYLVSVGYLHDMLINVWNWRAGSTVACNKFSTKVYAISFSELSDFFVTSGVRHVKFWYIDTSNAKSKHDVTIPIKGRAGLLGELRNHTFCDVVCGVGSNSDYTYCVTTAGALCCFNAKRKLEKFVEIGSSKALCLVFNEKYLICGYNNGYIRVFDASSLEFIATLPKPHYLGVNVADGINPSHMIAKTDNVTYGDTVAMALDNTHHRLTCVYSDHSLYVWDISDVKKVGKIWSSLYHSACVWGLEVYPDVLPGTTNEFPLPPGTFFTCSNDDTVRVWNVAEGLNISSVKNIYSKELLRILYVDQSYSNLKDSEMNPTSKNVRDVGPESKGGVRCIRASPDGQLLAVGERSGNVRVYECMFLDEILNIDAHESEVLCLEFSPPESGHKLLGSAGRDRLIHVFDVNKDFTLIQTLDDHSASITSLKFSVEESGSLLLLSCSADKSIIFRIAQNNPDLQFVRNTNYVGKTTLYDMVVDPSRGVAAVACQDRNIRVYDSHTGKQTKCYKGAQSDDGTLVKITMDNSGYFAATSSSDKSLSLYEFDTGECMATMSGHSEIVTGMRFTNDLKKLITISGDGCIFIWTIPTTYTQYMTERLCELGQEPPRQVEPETPLRRGTYRVDGGDAISMQSLNGLESPSNDIIPEEPTSDLNPPVADYRFSIGQLPSWAKKQIIAEGEDSGETSKQQLQSPPSQDRSSEAHSSSSSISHTTSENGVGLSDIQLLAEQSLGGPSQPAGRWAQRAGNVNLHVVTETSPQRPVQTSPQQQPIQTSPQQQPGQTSPQQEPVQSSPQRPISLPLDLSSPERKKFSTGSGAWQEQVDVLSKSPLERKCSLTSGEDDDLFQINNKMVLEPLKEDEICKKSHSSKNHGPRSRKMSSDLVFIETEEIKFEEAKESKDDDVKESIIYFPQSQDDIESETARSFQVTAAQKPERRSVGDNEVEERTENKKRKSQDESSSEDEEDPLSALEDVKPDEDVKTNDKSNDEEDGEEEVKKYFECLASSPSKETLPELPKPTTPEDNKTDTSLPYLAGRRLSISARFLSRSLLTTARTGQPGMETVSEEQRKTSLEEHKLEIQRRREEMTRAVDLNRKRLTALRKAKEERELKNSQTPGVSTISITLRPSPPRRISLDLDLPTKTLSADNIGNETFLKQHRSLSSPFPVPLEQLTPDINQPERLEKETGRCQSNSGNLGNSSYLAPVVTNLFENKLSSLHEQLIPEKDDNVWVKQDEKNDNKKQANNVDNNTPLATNSVNEKQEHVAKEHERELHNGKVAPTKETEPEQNDKRIKASQELKNKEESEILKEMEKAEKEEKEKAEKEKEKAEKEKEQIEKEKAEKKKETSLIEELQRQKEKELKEMEDKEQKEREILKARKEEEEQLKAKREEERQKEKARKEEVERAEERAKEEERNQKAIQEKKEKEQQLQIQRESEKAQEEQESEKQRTIKKSEEREKQREIENAKEGIRKEKELEKVKELERKKEKQRAIEKVKEREKQKEVKKQNEIDKVKELEREKEKQMEIEKEKEREKQKELEKAKQEVNEKETQKQKDIDKAKEDEKHKAKEREQPKEKDKKDARDKDEGKDNKKERPKMEKRGSSSSLMAQTKSSWRKSLGFSGFKPKEKKEEKRDSTPFAQSLRTSDHPKRSEKVLFRDKKGKVSAEDRKSKAKSLGDLEAKLRPMREEICLDSSAPPSRVLATEDIPNEKRSSSSSSPRLGAAAQASRRQIETFPVTDRRSPIGKAEGGISLSKFQIYQDAVSQLNQAIKSITDLHSQVLEEDHSDDKEEMLSLLTNTFTDTEEHCKQLRLRSMDDSKPRDPSKPLASNFSFSMNNLDTFGSKPTVMNRRASEACVPSAVEQEEASKELLMRYSDILVEMVKQKLSN